MPAPGASSLFPYTTLFRSPEAVRSRPAPGRGGVSRERAHDRGPGRRGAAGPGTAHTSGARSEEHTSELQSHSDLVCRLLLEKKKKKEHTQTRTGTTS